MMEFGKLQGEVAAAAQVGFFGEGTDPTLVGQPFNVVAVSLISTGLLAVTLHDAVDPLNCMCKANGQITTEGSVAVNPSGLDTDKVKRFLVTNLGTPANIGIHFIVVRTSIG